MREEQTRQLEEKARVEKEAEEQAKKEALAAAWAQRWNSEKRVWADKSGQFSVEAVYDTYLDDGEIRLLKHDQLEIVIRLSRLSDQDRRKALELKQEAQQRLKKSLQFNPEDRE